MATRELDAALGQFAECGSNAMVIRFDRVGLHSIGDDQQDVGLAHRDMLRLIVGANREGQFRSLSKSQHSPPYTVSDGKRQSPAQRNSPDRIPDQTVESKKNDLVKQLLHEVRHIFEHQCKPIVDAKSKRVAIVISLQLKHKSNF